MREDRGRGGDVGLNTRGEVSYLRATIYYFVCYINMIVFIDNKSRLHQWMKKKKILDARKKSKCVGNKASRNFTRVLLGHYPCLEILLKHRSLNNKCDGTAAFFLLNCQNLQLNLKQFKSRRITFQNEKFGIFILLLEDGLSNGKSKLSHND